MINYLQNTGKADEISFGLIETDRNTQKDARILSGVEK